MMLILLILRKRDGDLISSVFVLRINIYICMSNE